MTAKKNKATKPPRETLPTSAGPLEANPRTSPMGITPDDHAKALADREKRVRAALDQKE